MHLLPLLAFAVCTTAGGQPLTDRIIALRAGTLLAVDPRGGGEAVQVVAEDVGYASLSPGGRFLVFFRTVDRSTGRKLEARATKGTAEAEECVVLRDCRDPQGREHVLLSMPAEAARRAMRERFVAWAPTGAGLAFVGLNEALDACVFVAGVKRDAKGRKAELYATGVAATATARDQGLRVRSFSPDGNALVCENRFASYVVSLADGATAKLPGIFHSWSPRGDLLACNGNYRYPAQHFGLQPYFWDRTMAGVPLFRLVYPTGRVKSEQKNATFLRWSPDGSQLLYRATHPQPGTGLMLFVSPTSRTGRGEGDPLCRAPAWLSWHPGGELMAWCNVGGCYVANPRRKQSARVPGSVAEGWCQWVPAGPGESPRLLYLDQDHMQVVSANGQVVARAANPLSGSAPDQGDTATPAPRRVPSRRRGDPPEVIWSAEGTRFALTDAESRVWMCELATLERRAETSLAQDDESEGSKRSAAPRDQRQPRVLVGWTAVR